MAKPTLTASSVGKDKANSAFKLLGNTQEFIAGKSGTTRQLVSQFLDGRPVEKPKFIAICEALSLKWQEIAELEGIVITDDPNPLEIDYLVQEVKQKIGAYVTELCGTMQVLNREQSVVLEQIYTDVNILEKISSNNYVDYKEVLAIGKGEDVDRWKIKERIAGLEAVETHKKLMVLGKPGSGKTTFLKYLAISCLKGKFHSELVPIFVTLKRYSEVNGSPSLEEYILGELQHREVTEKEAKLLLDNGKVLILLDGLDEIKNEHDDRVKQNIETFSIRWLKNRFAITCRIGAGGDVFERFTNVEVADFDDEQIKIFVNKWFLEKGQTSAGILLEKLEDNKPVKELAKTPLLLTLICYLFENHEDLPSRRSDIYKDGLEVLMKTWDAKRRIKRDQIYIQDISLRDKQDMLGQIALRGFEKGKYFFEKEDLQRQIENICNLTNSDDGEVILKAIEHHHGLLVERARNIYSFSHLTFQEYFTAREIDREQKLETLMQHITDPRWKEVFLLTAEMLRQPDEFLLMMKEAIDLMLAGDEKLQAYLLWAKQKADSVNKTYKNCAVRALYNEISFCRFVITLASSKHISNRILEHFRSLPETRLFNITHALNCNLTTTLDLNLDTDFRLDLNLTFAIILASSFDFNFTLVSSLDSKLETDIVDGILQQILQNLKDRLPSPNSNSEDLFQWWANNGEVWKCELRQACIEHRNIGHDWQFTEEQLEILTKYYDANLLLVQCMNRSGYLSKQVRKEIEATLLLPREK